MLETVLAVLVVAVLFHFLFRFSYMLTSKILLEHAAMRVARARAVGMNEFMCLKAARVLVIPVAGKRLWPSGDPLDWRQELANVAIYMGTPDAAVARGVLDYEGWNEGRLHVNAGDGTDSSVKMRSDWLDLADVAKGYGEFELSGQASVEENYRLYMDDQGR